MKRNGQINRMSILMLRTFLPNNFLCILYLNQWFLIFSYTYTRFMLTARRGKRSNENRGRKRSIMKTRKRCKQLDSSCQYLLLSGPFKTFLLWRVRSLHYRSYENHTNDYLIDNGAWKITFNKILGHHSTRVLCSLFKYWCLFVGYLLWFSTREARLFWVVKYRKIVHRQKEK